MLAGNGSECDLDYKYHHKGEQSDSSEIGVCEILVGEFDDTEGDEDGDGEEGLGSPETPVRLLHRLSSLAVHNILLELDGQVEVEPHETVGQEAQQPAQQGQVQ